MFFFSRLLQSSISQLLKYNKLEVFLGGQLYSIVFDRMSILFASKGQNQPKIPRLDVLLTFCLWFEF